MKKQTYILTQLAVKRDRQKMSAAEARQRNAQLKKFGWAWRKA